MIFAPFAVKAAGGERVDVEIVPASPEDLRQTQRSGRQTGLLSDTQTAKWYFDAATGERQRYYDLFFRFCRKHKVEWATATKMEKEFISEVTRVTWEIQEEKITGVKRNIRPFFAAK